MQQMLNHLIFLHDCLSDLWQGCPPRNVVQRARGDKLDPEDRSNPARVRRILSALDPRAMETEGARMILIEVNLSMWRSHPSGGDVSKQLEHMLTTCLARLISRFTPREERDPSKSWSPPTLSPLEWTTGNTPALCRLNLQWHRDLMDGWGIDAGHAVMEVGRGVLRELRMRGLRSVLHTLNVRPWDRGETYRALQTAAAQHHPYDQSEIVEWVRRLLQIITVPEPGAARMIRQVCQSTGIPEEVWAKHNTYEELARVILRELTGPDDDPEDGIYQIVRYLGDTWCVPTVQMPAAEMAMRTLRGMADICEGIRPDGMPRIRWLGTIPVTLENAPDVRRRLNVDWGDFVVLADGHLFLIEGWPQHQEHADLWQSVSIWPVGGCPRGWHAYAPFPLRPDAAISAEEAEPLRQAARAALGQVHTDLNPPPPLDARAEGVSLSLTFETAQRLEPDEEGRFSFTPDMKVYCTGSKLPMAPDAKDDKGIWKRMEVQPIATITGTDQHGNPQEETASETTAQLACALMAMSRRDDK